MSQEDTHLSSTTWTPRLSMKNSQIGKIQLILDAIMNQVRICLKVLEQNETLTEDEIDGLACILRNVIDELERADNTMSLVKEPVNVRQLIVARKLAIIKGSESDFLSGNNGNGSLPAGNVTETPGNDQDIA